MRADGLPPGAQGAYDGLTVSSVRFVKRVSNATPIGEVLSRVP